MKSLLYILFCAVFVLSSCDKGNEPDIPGGGEGTEQPGNGNGNGNGEEPGNGENPEPEIPEYDKETQVLLNGRIWDKMPIDGYYTYTEALEIAEYNNKRIPEVEEWTNIAESYSMEWDEDNYGYWIGEDSSLLSQSEKSIFVKIQGYQMVSFDYQVDLYNSHGWYWRKLKTSEYQKYGDKFKYYVSFCSPRYLFGGDIYMSGYPGNNWQTKENKLSVLLIQ